MMNKRNALKYFACLSTAGIARLYSYKGGMKDVKSKLEG